MAAQNADIGSDGILAKTAKPSPNFFFLKKSHNKFLTVPGRMFLKISLEKFMKKHLKEFQEKCLM